MSSREIAELCDARHNDVVATIERLFAKGVLRESRNTTRPYQPEGGGRPTEVYDLTKRDTLVVVSGYSDELRARIIDRWEELEREVRAPRPRALHGREVRAQFKFGLSIAKEIGLLGNQALLAANGLTRETTGIDVLVAMGQARLVAPQPEVLLTATDIGRELGGLSAIKVNDLLATHGYQTGRRDWKGKASWEPTDKGLEAGAVMVDVDRGNGTGNSRQLRWASSVVDALREAGAA